MADDDRTERARREADKAADRAEWARREADKAGTETLSSGCAPLGCLTIACFFLPPLLVVVIPLWLAYLWGWWRLGK